MSYRAIVAEGGIPLSLHVPNKATARVLCEARKLEKRSKYKKAANLAEFVALMEKPSKC